MSEGKKDRRQRKQRATALQQHRRRRTELLARNSTASLILSVAGLVTPCCPLQPPSPTALKAACITLTLVLVLAFVLNPCQRACLAVVQQRALLATHGRARCHVPAENNTAQHNTARCRGSAHTALRRKGNRVRSTALIVGSTIDGLLETVFLFFFCFQLQQAAGGVTTTA